MKKKILALIAALTCVSAGAVGLVACGGGDNGGNGGGGGDKQVTGLVFVDKDGAEHHYYDSDSFVYGSRPSYDSVKLYIVYSDGTKREAGDSDSDKIKIEYRYNDETLAEAPTSFALGSYEESYKYEDLSPITYSYKIVTTATATPYSINVNSEWKYGEEPTVTVRDSSSEVVDKTKYSVRYIEADKYDEIKNAADFTDQLQQESGNAYTSTSGSEESQYLNVRPGEYYFFALFTTGGVFNSTFRKVTIKKGELTPTYTGKLEDIVYLANNWWNEGETGKVNISNIAVGVKYGDITWNDRNGEQYRSSYDIEWKNPDERVDCSIDGQARQIKCVFADDCYEDYIFPDPITVKLRKASLSRHGIYDTIAYDGEDHDIVLRKPNSGDPYSAEELEKFNKMVTVKDADGNPVTIGEGGVIATVCDEGEYTYTFVLKDKVNYDWWWMEYDNDNELVDIRTTDDQSSTFTINPLGSWMQPFSSGYDVSIDENKQIKLKVNPGTDSAVNNSSPYKSGTLQATVLSEYKTAASSTTYTTEIEATATIVKEEDGYDYIVITVTDFEGKGNGRVVLEVKATGDQHYEDVYRVFYYLYIKRYDPVCPIEYGSTIEVTRGTKVSELYNTYPELETKLGKWTLYLSFDSGWIKLEDNEALPKGEFSCKLVFESNFVDYVYEAEEIEFTLKGVEADS